MPRSPGRGGEKAGRLSRQPGGEPSPSRGARRAQDFRGSPSGTPRFTIGASPGLTRTITGAVAGTAGRILLTAAAHGLDTGHQVTVAGVGGVPVATGQWTAIFISANTFELASSTFAGTYTSGGTVTRF